MKPACKRISKNHCMRLKSFFAFIFVFVLSVAVEAQIAVKGDLIWTMAGDPIQNGVILIKDGKIEKVGTKW